MGINFNIKFQKKDLWLVAAIIVFLVGVGYVIAYNSGASPSVMGHDADEIEGVHKVYILDISVLQNYVDIVSCPGLPGNSFYFQTACHRYCANTCKGGGVTNCDGTPDSGLEYSSGFVIEIDCSVTNNAACVCVN